RVSADSRCPRTPMRSHHPVNKYLFSSGRRRGSVPLTVGGRSVMKFRVIFREASCTAQSPVRIVEESTGHEIGWANRYLDREYVRRSADKTLQAYAYNLLHFVRWWASIHHTGD